MKLLKEIKDDLGFIKSHKLQPTWFKILKVFILLGFFAGYCYFFGIIKTLIFFAIFFSLSFLMHLLYRAKTKKWTQSWLDFVVEENDEFHAKSIGIFYYSAIIIIAILALAVSQNVP